MKTFADCKVGDDMYVCSGSSIKIEKILKIKNTDRNCWIHTESCCLPCPKNKQEDMGIMFCTSDSAIKYCERALAWHQKQIDVLQQSINDLKEI